MTVPVPAPINIREADYCKQKFYSRNFSEQDLSRLKMKHSLFMNCNFDRANMSETDCEGSEFFGSSFVDTVCYRTNFRDAKLAGTKFFPKDAMGMTITLSCATFDEMKIAPIWWFAWLIMCTMMKPDLSQFKENPMDKLISAIGAERYVKLRGLFSKRNV